MRFIICPLLKAGLFEMVTISVMSSYLMGFLFKEKIDRRVYTIISLYIFLFIYIFSFCLYMHLSIFGVIGPNTLSYENGEVHLLFRI